jgi:hypothetical protein
MMNCTGGSLTRWKLGSRAWEETALSVPAEPLEEAAVTRSISLHRNQGLSRPTGKRLFSAKYYDHVGPRTAADELTVWPIAVHGVLRSVLLFGFRRTSVELKPHRRRLSRRTSARR